MVGRNGGCISLNSLDTHLPISPEILAHSQSCRCIQAGHRIIGIWFEYTSCLQLKIFVDYVRQSLRAVSSAIEHPDGHVGSFGYVSRPMTKCERAYLLNFFWPHLTSSCRENLRIWKVLVVVM
jgi:hypothetical protein